MSLLSTVRPGLVPLVIYEPQHSPGDLCALFMQNATIRGPKWDGYSIALWPFGFLSGISPFDALRNVQNDHDLTLSFCRSMARALIDFPLVSDTPDTQGIAEFLYSPFEGLEGALLPLGFLSTLREFRALVFAHFALLNGTANPYPQLYIDKTELTLTEHPTDNTKHLTPDRWYHALTAREASNRALQKLEQRTVRHIAPDRGVSIAGEDNQYKQQQREAITKCFEREGARLGYTREKSEILRQKDPANFAFRLWEGE